MTDFSTKSICALALTLLCSSFSLATVVEQGYYEMGDADQPVGGQAGSATTRDVSLFTRGLTRVDDSRVSTGASGVLAVYNGNTSTGAADPALTSATVTAGILAVGTPSNNTVTPNSSAATAPTSAPYILFVPNSGTASSKDETTSVSTNAYLSFTVTPADAANGLLNLSSLTLKAESGGASTPRGFNVRSSVDNYATDLMGTGSADIATVRPNLVSFSANLTGAAFQNLPTITFRVYAYTPSTGQSIDFDDIVLSGFVANNPMSPVVMASAPPASGSNGFPREGDVYSTQFGPNTGVDSTSSYRHYEYDVAGTPTPLITVADNFGVEGYLYMNSANVGTAIPIYNGNSNDTGWGFAIDGSQHLMGRIGTGASVFNFGSATVPLNQWVHVALVRDAGTTTLYVNGAPAGSDSAHVPSFTSQTSRPVAFSIGASFTDRTSSFPGLIDEVRIFTFSPGGFVVGEDLLDNPLGQIVPTPQPPTSLQVTGLTSTSVTLSWTASPGPAQNSSYSAVTSYSILESISGSYYAATSGLSGVSGTVSGLSASTTHSWVVQAFDASGTASAPSSSIMVTLPTPGTPTISGKPTYSTGSGFQFSVKGAANQTAILQATSTLGVPSSWVTLQSVMPSTSLFNFTDPNASQFTQRFYRVMQP